MTLRAEDFMRDVFQDTRIAEQSIIRQTRDELAAIEAQIQLTQRAQAIQSSPGWADYVKSIDDALVRSTNELILTTKSSEYMRQLQGRIQALRDVVAILARGKSLLEELATRRQVVQDRLTELLRQMPLAARSET
jgi:hypothetical protein